MTTHEKLLTEAVEHSSAWRARLAGKSILVTGASGFLSSSLLIFLQKLNDRYNLRIDLHATARRRPEEVRLFKFLNCSPPSQWTVASVESSVVPDIPGIAIVHAASFGAPNDYMRYPLETFRANTEGILSLYRSGARSRAAHIMYLSSAEVYGQPDSNNIPTTESYLGALPTLDARSIYGESKRMAEVLCATLSKSENIGFTVVRPWNVYGPGQRSEDGRVPMEFMRQGIDRRNIGLTSNGKPTRSFCHVWTAVRQMAGLLAIGPTKTAWNVGFGKEEVSMLELANLCAHVCGLPASAVTYDANAENVGMQRSVPCTTNVDDVLGACPDVRLSQGLLTLCEWIKYLSR